MSDRTAVDAALDVMMRASRRLPAECTARLDREATLARLESAASNEAALSVFVELRLASTAHESLAERVN